MSELRIYVASLADYNAGNLHGKWIDCEGKDVDDLQAEVDDMLERSKLPDAEEFAIHDAEGFGDLIGEYTPLSQVASYVEIIDEHDEAGLAWIEVAQDLGLELDDFDDHYRGEWNDFEEYATNWFDEVYYELVKMADSQAYVTIDYEQFARDLRHEYSVVENGGTVYVFQDEA